jgi:hypothetical protein
VRDSCSRCDRYKGEREPKTNCTTCWDRYFNAQPMQIGLAKYGFGKFGDEKIIGVKGETFVKQAKRYLVDHPDILPPKPVEEKKEVEHCKRCGVPLDNQGFCIVCGRSGK